MRYKITKSFSIVLLEASTFSLRFLLENAFRQLNPSIARLISSMFASL